MPRKQVNTADTLRPIPESRSKSLLPFIRIVVDERLFLRDPQETELGRRMLQDALELISERGIEPFTFAKLAQRCESTEASVYRYFHNKHELLGYLVAWYWAWLDYRVVFRNNNITDPFRELQAMIEVLVQSDADNSITPWMNERYLRRLVASESGKLQLASEHTAAAAYAHQGVFTSRMAKAIARLSPGYLFPNALASLLIVQAHQQRWYAEHLPRLTEIRMQEDDNLQLIQWLEHLLNGCLAINTSQQKAE